jgi:hypothetical protein
MLPREVPPSFAGTNLGALASCPLGANTWTTPIDVSFTRWTGDRRRLSLPHPRGYSRIAELMAVNWDAIRARASQNTYALSSPVVNKRPIGRAIVPRYPYGDIAGRRLRIYRRGRYVIQADVAQFYGSIYTHSIEWADIGRAAAKARLGINPRPAPGVGALLDQRMQQMQSGQTHGILVGPDASFVVAEMILSSALAPLKRTRENSWRFSDDIEFVTGSETEAHELLARLEVALAEYGLATNPRKTTVRELPQPFVDAHIVRLRSARLRAEDPRDFEADIVGILSSAIDEARSGTDQAQPLAWVLGWIDIAFEQHHANWTTPQRRRVWRAVAQALLGLASSHPVLLDSLDYWLEFGGSIGCSLPRADLNQFVNNAVPDAVARGYSIECAWLVQIAARAQVRLSSSCRVALERSGDQFIQLCLLAAHEWSVVANADLTAMATASADDEAANSESWLRRTRVGLAATILGP